MKYFIIIFNKDGIPVNDAGNMSRDNMIQCVRELSLEIMQGETMKIYTNKFDFLKDLAVIWLYDSNSSR